jgi:hypothetical protein
MVSGVEVPPSVKVPPVEAPPLTEVVPASEVASDTAREPEDGGSAAWEDFFSRVTKDISSPLLDRPPRRHRVDPVLVDTPTQLPLSEVSGLGRSRRQALDILSVVKRAK